MSVAHPRSKKKNSDMFDHLSGRCAFVAECDYMRADTETVDEDKKMTAVDFAEIGMDLFKRAGGRWP